MERESRLKTQRWAERESPRSRRRLHLQLTGIPPANASESLVDTAIKIFTYYGHERLWNRIGFGRREESQEDYMI